MLRLAALTCLSARLFNRATPIPKNSMRRGARGFQESLRVKVRCTPASQGTRHNAIQHRVSSGNYRLANNRANEIMSACEPQRACFRRRPARPLQDDAVEHRLVLCRFWRRRAKGARCPCGTLQNLLATGFRFHLPPGPLRSRRPRSHTGFFCHDAKRSSPPAGRPESRALPFACAQGAAGFLARCRRQASRAQAPWRRANRFLSRLGEECEKRGRRRVFDVVSSCLAAEREDVSYAKLSKPLGVPEVSVKRLVHQLRRRYRSLLRDEVAQTVERPEEIDDELRYLAAALVAAK